MPEDGPRPPGSGAPGAPARFDRVEEAVDALLARVGRRLVVGTPLGLGKANHLVNELYRRAADDPGIDLRIVTALTLARPRPKSDLERRLGGPIVERLFGDYPELAWVEPLRTGTLPDNIQISSFYFPPGAYLSSPRAQQDYVSANYTHVTRDLLHDGINVLLQSVAASDEAPGRYSLSSNPDLSLDLIDCMRERERGGSPVAIAAQVNRKLPYMPGPSELPEDAFDLVLDAPAYEFDLFGPPYQSVGTADYMIALHATALVRDGGSLQLGIGALGDAITRMLQLRHENPQTYRELLAAADVYGPNQHGEGVWTDLIDAWGGTDRFERGLFGASEMLVPGFLELYRSGILKRRAFDHLGVQRAVDAGALAPGDALDADLLDRLVGEGYLAEWLGPDDVPGLVSSGFLKAEARGPLDLSTPAARRQAAERWLAPELGPGALAHAGFFLGPGSFYQALHDLSHEEREAIRMTRISWVNELYGEEALKRVQRRDARFLNTGLIATLLGAVASDGFEDGRVLSGVGGQYNFVTMAQELEDGRSVLMIRSVRDSGGDLTSNIRWTYGHVTVPRHLRDILVTEYGIADLRGKTDAEVIAATLRVADSRFQDELMAKAKEAKKLPASFVLEDRFRDNTPERLETTLEPFRKRGLLPALPFGDILTDTERTLQKALEGLKERVSGGWLDALPRPDELGDLLGSPPEAARPYLERMELDRPGSVKERLLARAVVWALEQEGAI